MTKRMSERNLWPRAERAYRREDKKRLYRRRIKPSRKCWAVCVETTVIQIPHWAQDKALDGMSVGDHHVWFKGRLRKDVKRLMLEDRQAGGDPEYTQVEWRRCPNCKRILLNIEAEARRILNESSRLGREIPCGPECGNG